jgi:hypothetical protein
VPPDGALEGRLVYARKPGCRLGSLDLVDLTLEATGRRPGCGLTVSPDGTHAVIRTGTEATADSTLRLVRLDREIRVVRQLGPVTGDAAWDPEGARVAWCAPDGATRVLDLGAGLIEHRAGCTPRFTPTGALLTIVDEPERRSLYLDGKPILSEDTLASGFDQAPSGVVHLLGADQREDGLLAVVASAAPRGIVELLAERGIEAGAERIPADVWHELGLAGPYGALALSAGGSLPELRLQLWQDGHLQTSLPLRGSASYALAMLRFGELVRFSPDGRELALGVSGTSSPLMLLDVQTLDPTLGPIVQHGFAWSPDGAYFAFSTGSEVRISGALRSQPAYILPLAAESLVWTLDD